MQLASFDSKATLLATVTLTDWIRAANLQVEQPEKKAFLFDRCGYLVAPQAVIRRAYPATYAAHGSSAN